MSSRAPVARHRAQPQRSSLTTIARAVSSNAGGVGRRAAIVATASGMVFSVGVVPAQAAVDREANPVTEVTGLMSAAAISVPVDAKISFDRAAITSAPAPAPGTAEVAVQSQRATELAAQQADRAAARTAERTAANTPARTAAKTPEPAAAKAAESAPVEEAQTQAAPADSAIAAGIAAAAYAQLGVNQDCTMLVTNALSAVGINHHGWPDSYFALGTRVSAAQAQPGDLVYYADGGVGLAHIAVYVGNGQAVHGGWHGSTRLASVNVGSGPVFIHVDG